MDLPRITCVECGLQRVGAWKHIPVTNWNGNCGANNRDRGTAECAQKMYVFAFTLIDYKTRRSMRGVAKMLINFTWTHARLLQYICRMLALGERETGVERERVNGLIVLLDANKYIMANGNIFILHVTMCVNCKDLHPIWCRCASNKTCVIIRKLCDVLHAENIKDVIQLLHTYVRTLLVSLAIQLLAEGGTHLQVVHFRSLCALVRTVHNHTHAHTVADIVCMCDVHKTGMSNGAFNCISHWQFYGIDGNNQQSVDAVERTPQYTLINEQKCAKIVHQLKAISHAIILCNWMNHKSQHECRKAISVQTLPINLYSKCYRNKPIGCDHKNLRPAAHRSRRKSCEMQQHYYPTLLDERN